MREVGVLNIDTPNSALYQLIFKIRNYKVSIYLKY